jgi:hypothetical protein
VAVLKRVRVLELERGKSNEFDFLSYMTTGYANKGLCVVSASTGLGFKSA